MFMFLFTYGAMSGYAIIAADAFPIAVVGLFGLELATDEETDEPLYPWWLGREFVIMIFTLAIFLPLSLYRDVGKLGRYSMAAMVALVFVGSLVAFQAVATGSFGTVGAKEEGVAWWIAPRVFPAIGVLSGAYVCHHNSFLLFASMQPTSKDNAVRARGVPSLGAAEFAAERKRRWRTSIRTAVFLSFVLLTAVGVCGFVAFRGDARGNILLNLPDDGLTHAARLSMVLVVSLTYPLEAFVAREALQTALWASVAALRQRTGRALVVAAPAFVPSWLRSRSDTAEHVVLTLAIVALCTATALSVRELGAVSELNGGLNAVALAYVLPACVGLRLGTEPLWSRAAPRCIIPFRISGQKAVCIVLLILGVISSKSVVFAQLFLILLADPLPFFFCFCFCFCFFLCCPQK
jgi:solute carrier family 38 (sodium-coupled neutral amino acid transporter), member 11